jgi:hypothetical protein
MALIDRMLRAARLDPHLFEEVEAEPRLTREAMVVVVLSSLAAAIGGYGHLGPRLALLALVALVSWYIWAFLTYWIGTQLLRGPQTQADVGQLLRVLGYSSAPGVLRIAGLVPALTGPVFAAANVWMIIAMVVAVRQALDYTSTWRALAVVILGGIIHTLAIAAVMSMLKLG